jgi:hypothetical protein
MLTAGKSARPVQPVNFQAKDVTEQRMKRVVPWRVKPSPLAGAEVFLFLPFLFIPIDEYKGKVPIKVIRKRI